MPQRLSLLYCGLLATLFSCSTDITLESEWKDIPVVYGFLNQTDSAHYIRVEKAFLEPGGNALDIAQIVDSLYYDDNRITVELERVTTGERFVLQRVDGNLEGYPREEGVFASEPNYLYKIRDSEIQLRGGEEIRFILNRGDELEPATARTFILDTLRVSLPFDPLRLARTTPLTISWFAGDFAAVFDVRWVINYLEQPPGGGAFEEKSLVWVVNDLVERTDFMNDRVAINYLGEDFYRFLGESLEADGSLRRLNGIDIQVRGIGQEYIDFLEVANANLGITSAQNTPVFSNIDQGQGIFTSRSQGVKNDYSLDQEALDSLESGVFTRDLNFIR